jgi:hypothetical protein
MSKSLTAKKARKILHDKEVRGHPLTDKQRKFFGAIAGGERPYTETAIDAVPNVGLWHNLKGMAKSTMDYWDDDAEEVRQKRASFVGPVKPSKASIIGRRIRSMIPFVKYEGVEVDSSILLVLEGRDIVDIVNALVGEQSIMPPTQGATTAGTSTRTQMGTAGKQTPNRSTIMPSAGRIRR